MDLPEPLERIFGEEIDAYQKEKEKRMPFVTITERMAMERGCSKGSRRSWKCDSAKRN